MASLKLGTSAILGILVTFGLIALMYTLSDASDIVVDTEPPPKIPTPLHIERPPTPPTPKIEKLDTPPRPKIKMAAYSANKYS